MHMSLTDAGGYSTLYDLFSDAKCAAKIGESKHQGVMKELPAKATFTFVVDKQEYTIRTGGYRFIAFDGNEKDLIFIKFAGDSTLVWYAPMLNPATRKPMMTELSRYFRGTETFSE